MTRSAGTTITYACSLYMHSQDTLPDESFLRNGAWAAACGLLASVALVLGVSAALQNDWARAAAWLACAFVGVAAVVFSRKLPPFFGALLTLTAMVNSAGYVFNLWHERTMFDEVVHGFAFFAGVSSVGWFVLQQRPGMTGLFWKAALAALGAGLAWEAFEWMIGIIGDTGDTLIDLLMDMIGALVAAALLRKFARRTPTASASFAAARHQPKVAGTRKN